MHYPLNTAYQPEWGKIYWSFLTWFDGFLAWNLCSSSPQSQTSFLLALPHQRNTLNPAEGRKSTRFVFFYVAFKSFKVSPGNRSHMSICKVFLWIDIWYCCHECVSLHMQNCSGVHMHTRLRCITWKRRPCSLFSLISEVQEEEELSRELLLPPVGRSWQHFPNIFTWPSVLYGISMEQISEMPVIDKLWLIVGKCINFSLCYWFFTHK